MDGAVWPCHYPLTSCFFSRHLVQTVGDPSKLPWHCNVPVLALTLSNARRSLVCHRYKAHKALPLSSGSPYNRHCFWLNNSDLLHVFNCCILFCDFLLIQLCCKCVNDVPQCTYRGIPYCECTYTRCGTFDVNGF